MQPAKMSDKWPSTTFWAMKLKTGIRRCFKVRCPFLITLATLEFDPGEDSASKTVSLWYQSATHKALLCSLDSDCPQQVMRLYFFVDEVVSLYTVGQGTVNLLGRASTRRGSDASFGDTSDDSHGNVPLDAGDGNDKDKLTVEKPNIPAVIVKETNVKTKALKKDRKAKKSS